jgi:predicted phage-related endonuclease
MIDYLIDKKVPKDYNIQIQTQMICTGRTWCDFVAYHPGMELLIIRVEADETMQNTLIDAVGVAVEKVIQTLNKLK